MSSLKLEAVVSRPFVVLLDVIVVIPERGALVHEEVRSRLKLAGTEDALAAVERREWVEVALLLIRSLALEERHSLLRLLLLLGLEEELSSVALAQLQRLTMRLVAAAGGGGCIHGGLAPLVVRRLRAGGGGSALARTLEWK